MRSVVIEVRRHPCEVSRDADSAEAVALKDVAPCGAWCCWIPSPESLTAFAEEAALDVENLVDGCHQTGAPDGPMSVIVMSAGEAVAFELKRPVPLVRCIVRKRPLLDAVERVPTNENESGV